MKLNFVLRAYWTLMSIFPRSLIFWHVCEFWAKLTTVRSWFSCHVVLCIVDTSREAIVFKHKTSLCATCGKSVSAAHTFRCVRFGLKIETLYCRTFHLWRLLCTESVIHFSSIGKPYLVSQVPHLGIFSPQCCTRERTRFTPTILSNFFASWTKCNVQTRWLIRLKNLTPEYSTTDKIPHSTVFLRAHVRYSLITIRNDFECEYTAYVYFFICWREIKNSFIQKKNALARIKSSCGFDWCLSLSLGLSKGRLQLISGKINDIHLRIRWTRKVDSRDSLFNITDELLYRAKMTYVPTG